ncbi:FAD-binding oxidoreductase [Mangrovicoccus algicola]|uniref:D-lactate dehydrogenase (cytochrome) n=1 Tax=Mangrovicoccus algicola TaxID=2771008 RepID=A0A8J7CUT2_9RHOB|nr:FAD-linked oxidase C-terminal domain-containing protein [Mangrovicoccus algicola]MBE3637904.1 FAD-binding protein [Mangrovicoccus algicola]
MAAQRNATGIEAAVSLLADRLGPRLATGRSLREQHGHTTTWLENQHPDAVAFAQSAAEVQEIVRICAAHGAPVIPFGTGTSLEGHVNAPLGGISVDVSGMDRVLEIRPEDMDATVEPGVTREALNTELRATGLFFPVDPGANASLGGMASTRASGTTAVRYGTMRDRVLSLKAVLPSGEMMQSAARARKSSAGYDLTGLMVGAEGTLGIITELTLRLAPQPEAVSGAIASFADIATACQTAQEVIQMGLPVARMEFLDEAAVGYVNRSHGIGLPAAALLLLEFHGSPGSLAEQTETFAELARDNGATHVAWSSDPDERSRLWRARHEFYLSALALYPGRVGFSTDVCVPVSQLAACVTAARAKLDDLDLVGTNIGHVGDGNFHTLVFVDPADAAGRARAETYVSWLNGLAISHGGTCTGEHGIGQGKMAYLERELGPGALAMMRAVKQGVDPLNIMNPGKIFAF